MDTDISKLITLVASVVWAISILVLSAVTYFTVAEFRWVVRQYAEIYPSLLHQLHWLSRHSAKTCLDDEQFPYLLYQLFKGGLFLYLEAAVIQG